MHQLSKKINQSVFNPRVRWAGLCFVALLALSSFSPARATLGEADAALTAGQYRLAIVNYEAYMKENPNDGDVMIKAAQAYEGAKWYGRAVQWWDRYLKTYPEGPQKMMVTERAAECHRWLGANYYIIGGYYRMAIEELNKALVLNPNLADAYIWLGTIFQNEGLYDETVDILDKGLVMAPNDLVIQWMRKDAQHYRETGGNAYIAHRKGIALYEKGSKTDALKQFKVAAAESPDFAAAHLWIARILFEQRRFEASIPEWETAIRIRPDDDHAQFYLQLAQSNVAAGI